MGAARETSQPAGEAEGAGLSFEEALARLETIVHSLEEGATGLAEGLAHYEEGVGLLKQCYALLERAERRVELLTGVDAAGQPVSVPFDDAVESLETKAQTRSQRRSRPVRSSGERAEASGDRGARERDDGAGEPDSGSRSLFD